MQHFSRCISLTVSITTILMTDIALAGKSSELFVVEPQAAFTVQSFTQAIQNEHWDLALSLCEESIQQEAVKSVSAEAFLKKVVPLPEILWKAGVFGGNRKHGYRYFVRLGPDPTGETGTWEWAVRAKKDGNWRIHLPGLSIDEWRKEELAAIQNENEWRVRLKQEIARIQPFVKTILSATESVFKIGQPILLKLCVENQSEKPLYFDNSQATVNGSMTITKINGDSVPYVGPTCQTVMREIELPPHESKVVFDKMDLGIMYPLREPGTYQVQFNGHGGWIWLNDPYVNPVKRPSLAFGTDPKASSPPEREEYRHCPIASGIPSNTLTLTIR